MSEAKKHVNIFRNISYFLILLVMVFIINNRKKIINQIKTNKKHLI